MRSSAIEALLMLATVIQWLVLAGLAGLLVGSGVSVFLLALFALTQVTPSLSVQMLLLPCGGLACGLLMYYGYQLNRTGFKDELGAVVYEQQGKMPLRTLLIKPVAALITLSSGGSAGKEGPCSHIGAGVGAALGTGLGLNSELRKRLVACGVSAGFASVFGTPIAGAIYGVEVLAIGRIRHDFLLPAVIASITAYQACLFWQVPYEQFDIAFLADFSVPLLIQTILLGVLCGLVARLYVDAVQSSSALFTALKHRFKLWPPLLPMLGGLLLAGLILYIPTDYLGLSLPIMNDALAGVPMPYLAFLWKCLLVAITLGSGFYGGVVTPQFVIGALAGNAFAQFFGLEPAVGAAIGFVAVLASASNTPIAAMVLAVEMFGANSLLYAAGAAMSAYLLIGHRSIYPDQRLFFSKTSWIEAKANLPVGQEKLRVAYGLLKWWQRGKSG